MSVGGVCLRFSPGMPQLNPKPCMVSPQTESLKHHSKGNEECVCVHSPLATPSEAILHGWLWSWRANNVHLTCKV